MDQERWVWVKDFKSKYQVSDYGRVKSYYSQRGKRKTPKILNLTKYKAGYFMACLCRNHSNRRYRLSRLVALHFIPNPLNKPCVNHIDGVKTNNHYSNLEWVTDSENKIHAYRVLGLGVNMGFKKGHIAIPFKNGYGVISGENNYFSKLTQKQAREIRIKHNPRVRGFGCKCLAKRYNVSPFAIHKIVKNISYKEAGD